MADKVDKPKKKAKPKKDEKGVLAALPSTRPERIGTRRGPSAPKTTTATAASKAAARPSAKKRSTSAKAGPKTAAGAADERAAGAVPLSETPAKPATERTYPRPRPVREGAPGIGTAGYRDQSPESGRPSGAELAATAVKAAGEVAQLGLTIGGQVLKRVASRIPRP